MGRIALSVLLALVPLTGSALYSISQTVTPEASVPGVSVPGQGVSVAAQGVQESTSVQELESVFSEPLVSLLSIDMIIGFEIFSPARYERRYTRPVCPLCDTTMSGVTIGIGYDLGHQPASAIRQDWDIHPNVDELALAAGYKGRAAIPVTASMQHIVTPYPMAYDVFHRSTVKHYYRIALRSFGPEYNNLHPHVRGALLSLVINRGGNVNCRTRSREEMCNIARHGVPNHDYPYIASQIRAMKRLWNDRGLQRRRDKEADLVMMAVGDSPVSFMPWTDYSPYPVAQSEDDLRPVAQSEDDLRPVATFHGDGLAQAEVVLRDGGDS